MDPSIIKLLEEEEDENMHSGAEVEAFTAALNKDIKGDMPSSPISNSASGLSLDDNQKPCHMFPQWQCHGQHYTSQHNGINSQSQHEELRQQQQIQNSSEMLLVQGVSCAENLQQKFEDKDLNCSLFEPNGSHDKQQDKTESHDKHKQHHVEAITFKPNGRNAAQLESVKFEHTGYNFLPPQVDQISTPFETYGLPEFRENHVLRKHNSEHSSVSDSQTSKSQGMSSQPSTPQEHTSSWLDKGGKVPFAAILSFIRPHLEKDKIMQVESFYANLMKNDISKAQFIRCTKDVVGEQLLRFAVMRVKHSLAARTFHSTGINTKETPKKYYVGQKKPLEDAASSPSQSSKRQKVALVFSNQRIEQLNDVTAVSGVNLREEEEQLFSGPKEDCGVSEAARLVVQKEEERLLLQRIPLQKKLAKIVAKCGITSISNDMERCLSLCVEERLRGLIASLIKSSRQRVDVERERHHVLITSDVRQQIFLMNQKVREEWERTQVSSDKIQKRSEANEDEGLDGGKEKGHTMSVKSAKEEDDKTRATAANVAARAAMGGDDMLSKWHMMAEEARQKRDSADSHPSRSLMLKPPLIGRISRNYLDVESGYPSATISGGQYESQHPIALDSGTRSTISIKDLISVLERDPQMAQSILIYRLYNKVHDSNPTE